MARRQQASHHKAAPPLPNRCNPVLINHRQHLRQHYNLLSALEQSWHGRSTNQKPYANHIMIQRQWLGTSSLQLGDTRRKDHLMLTLQAFYIVILNWILTSVRSIGMQLTPEAHQCREFRWWIYQHKEEGQEIHTRMSQSE